MQAAIVTFDHLALAFLGCYGTTRVATPHFDRFASGSVVFDQCYGTAAVDPAFVGLPELTQRLPAVGGSAVVYRCTGDVATDTALHAAIDGWGRAGDGASPSLLWLQCPGIASPWTATPDQFVYAWTSAFPACSLPATVRECGLAPDGTAEPEEIIAAAWPQLLMQGWLSRDRVASSPAIGRLRWCIYAAAVTALDHWFGRVQALLTEAARPDSLLVVAAGAGDLTGPHAELTAGCPPLIAPLVHVPLLIRTATPEDGARRNSLVSIADLVPTLAEALHVGDAGDGRSLWPLLSGESQSIRDELLIGSDAKGWSLRTPAFACLAHTHDVFCEFSDRAWLFVKPDDAWETLNVAAQSPEITADCCRRMRAAVGGGVYE